MKHIIALAVLLCFSLTASAEDVRHQPLKDLNGYFPFNPPGSLDQWEQQKEYVRRQILVAAGLWPMPTKTPLNAVVHGKIDREGYTVQKVHFESAPGFFVTGNLYRPKNIQGKVPGVMFAHGHRKDARFYVMPEDTLRKKIADGEERFERAGLSTYQSGCRQLALMGCVVWQWDMLGDSDSIQLSRELVHGFAKQRPEVNTTEHWGLFSPQGMNSANDWTKEMATKGFPELQQLYGAYDKKDDVILKRGEHFPHNYNAVTRSAFYTFLNKHFKLGFTAPVIEKDFDPLPPEQLTVWDDQHPAPKAADPDFERNLLAWFTEDANQQLHGAAATPEGLQNVIRPAVEVLIGRTLANAGDVEWELKAEQDRGDCLETTGTLLNKTHGEEVNVVCLCPKQWKGRVIIWLDDPGKAALCSDDGSVKPAVLKLVQAGAAVLGADLFLQGGEPVKQTHVVANPREFAGYTFGYNHALFAQRTHDVLTMVSLLRQGEAGPCQNPKSVAIAGWQSTGPICAAAGAIAGEAVDRTAIDTQRFRFGGLLDYRDPMFLPGGAKYLDLPGLIALNAPRPLWLAGEGQEPAVVTAAYRAASQADELVTFTGKAAQQEATASQWLLK